MDLIKNKVRKEFQQKTQDFLQKNSKEHNCHFSDVAIDIRKNDGKLFYYLNIKGQNVKPLSLKTDVLGIKAIDIFKIAPKMNDVIMDNFNELAMELGASTDAEQNIIVACQNADISEIAFHVHVRGEKVKSLSLEQVKINVMA